MRGVVVGMISISIYAVVIASSGGAATPNAEEIVNRPRAQVYAQLDRLYSAFERKTATVTTVTGRGDVPVKFTFEREQGEMLSMSGTAGMRTVHLITWLEDGPAPGQTRVKVRFEPISTFRCSGETTVLSAVERVLWEAEAQAIEGKRITALFGGGTRKHC